MRLSDSDWLSDRYSIISAKKILSTRAADIAIGAALSILQTGCAHLAKAGRWRTVEPKRRTPFRAGGVGARKRLIQKSPAIKEALSYRGVWGNIDGKNEKERKESTARPSLPQTSGRHRQNRHRRGAGFRGLSIAVGLLAVLEHILRIIRLSKRKNVPKTFSDTRDLKHKSYWSRGPNTRKSTAIAR